MSPVGTWTGPPRLPPPPAPAPTPTPTGPIQTTLYHYVFLAGGNTNNLATLLRYGQLGTTFSVQNVAGYGDVLFVVGHVSNGWQDIGGYSPILPNGALLTAIQAAGAGHALVGLNVFDSTQPYAEIAILFGTGVSPRAWYGDRLTTSPRWTAATGTPAATGVDLAGGLFNDQALAVFSGQDTHHTVDGVAYTNDGTPPSAINDVLWEPGQSGVYLGAAVDGIVKTIDFGVTWGYIRPHATLGLTWPAGAVGRAVSMLVAPKSSSPPLFTVGTIAYKFFEQGVWNTKDGTPPDSDSTQLRYYGGGLMGHLTGAGVFRVSTNTGDSWTSRTLPGTTESIEGYDFAPSGRLWVFAWETTPTPDQGLIYRSDDNGANWTLSLAGFDLTQPLFLAVNQGNSNQIAATYKTTTNTLGIVVSTNGGASWTHRTVNAGTHQVGHASGKVIWIGSRIVVAYDLNTGFAMISWSDDFGATWTNAFSEDLGAADARVMDFISGGILGPMFVALDRTTLPILRSTNQGSSWEALSGG